MTPTLLDQYRRWFEYEKDSHRKVLESLDAVPEADRSSEPYQKALSIMGHVIAARQMWLHRMDPAFERPAELFPTSLTRDDLAARLATMERGWTDRFARLTEPELQRSFTYRATEGDWYRSTIYDVLTQLYGHSLYHRGQIASLVRAAGGQPAQTDFIFWVREPVEPPPS
jgi:uncharacterized damage-inducible protein DinB